MFSKRKWIIDLIALVALAYAEIVLTLWLPRGVLRPPSLPLDEVLCLVQRASRLALPLPLLGDLLRRKHHLLAHDAITGGHGRRRHPAKGREERQAEVDDQRARGQRQVELRKLQRRRGEVFSTILLFLCALYFYSCVCL